MCICPVINEFIIIHLMKLLFLVPWDFIFFLVISRKTILFSNDNDNLYVLKIVFFSCLFLCHFIAQDLKKYIYEKCQGKCILQLILMGLYCFTVKHYIKCLLENHFLFSSSLLNQFPLMNNLFLNSFISKHIFTFFAVIKFFCLHYHLPEFLPQGIIGKLDYRFFNRLI